MKNSAQRTSRAQTKSLAPNGHRNIGRAMAKHLEKNNSRETRLASSHNHDIVDLILRDHKPLKELIQVLKDEDVGITQKRGSFDRFASLLLAHARAEQESLYVCMKEEDDFRVEGIEGDIEHGLAEQLIVEIRAIHNDDDSWVAKVKVLAEMVDHHIKEEESHVLKQVRIEFDVKKLKVLAQEYSVLMSNKDDDDEELWADEPNVVRSNFF